jgi:hypothetical protein
VLGSPTALLGADDAEVDARAVLPQALELVERALLVVLDVHDDVGEVDEDPAAFTLPLTATSSTIEPTWRSDSAETMTKTSVSASCSETSMPVMVVASLSAAAAAAARASSSARSVAVTVLLVVLRGVLRSG